MTLHSASGLIKGEARQSLLGHLPIAVSANVVYLILSVGLTLLGGYAIPGSGYLVAAATAVILFLIDLVIGTLDYGLCAIYMGLQYRQSPGLMDLFLGFRENSFTILKVQAVLSAIDLAIGLPITVITAIYGDSWTSHLGIMLPLYLLTLAANLIVDLTYPLVWFILLDYPELTWREVLRSSRRLMRGNKRVLCYVWISLIPLYLLSIFSLGLAGLWILAYQHAATAAFYRGLVNARKR